MRRSGLPAAGKEPILFSSYASSGAERIGDPGLGAIGSGCAGRTTAGGPKAFDPGNAPGVSGGGATMVSISSPIFDRTLEQSSSFFWYLTILEWHLWIGIVQSGQSLMTFEVADSLETSIFRVADLCILPSRSV